MYFYRICVLYRLRRRAQHKMREKMKWARRWMCVAKRVFGLFFLPGRRWWDNINHTYTSGTYARAYIFMPACLYVKTLAAKKISLEILKALGREKTGYDTLKLSFQTKWNEKNYLSVTVWVYVSVVSVRCAYVFELVCVDELSRVWHAISIQIRACICIHTYTYVVIYSYVCMFSMLFSLFFLPGTCQQRHSYIIHIYFAFRLLHIFFRLKDRENEWIRRTQPPECRVPYLNVPPPIHPLLLLPLSSYYF